MAVNTSLSPIAENRFDLAAARHLLWRVGYAGAPAEVRELQTMGRDRAVGRLVDYGKIDDGALPTLDLDPDVLRKLTDEERQRYRQARQNGDQDVLDEQRRMNLKNRGEDRKMMGRLRQWWIERILATPRPAEERLTLLWHGHFASSHRSVRDAYLMQQQNHLFRRHANRSFADLARGIVRDPAMIKYLNNDRNFKRKPNENLARELMELFTLGVGNYTERDIKEGARALTGYTLDDNDFAFRKGQHDNEPKTILGKTGNYDGDAFVEILLKKDACAKFVALKIYDTFVADVGDVYDAVPRGPRKIIDGLAKRLYRNGYQLKPVLTELFKSQHFHDPGIVGQKIKSPTQLLAGTVRGLATPTRSKTAMASSMASMGQVLFEPPTVDGWSGGRAWINTSTLFVRQNLTTYLISGQHPAKAFRPGQTEYDPRVLLAGLEDKSADAVTDYLIDHAVGPHVSAPRRAPLHRFMTDRGDDTSNENLVALLSLITAMPEYQLC
ncbi:MAG: DUF1800 domain-containing protein [Planctomycetota bacterium]